MVAAERRNELSVDVAPGGLAVQTHHRITLAFVHVVHTKAGNVAEMRLEWKRTTEGLICRNHRARPRVCITRPIVEPTSESLNPMLVEGVMPIKPGRRNDRCMISIDRALLQVYRPERLWSHG